MRKPKLIYTKTAHLSEEQWQDLRYRFVTEGKIGGSDAGTLLGINQYTSPINLFYKALGLVNFSNKMNNAMMMGKLLESHVASCWQYYDGTDDGFVENQLAGRKIKKYRRVKAIVENPDYPMLFANLDGKIISHPDYSTPGVLEIKTISGYSSDNYEAGFPPSYLVQLQHYMLVTGMTWGEICYLKDGRQLGLVTFEADKELQQRILVAATEFQKRVKMAQQAMRESGLSNVDELMSVAAQFEPEPDTSEAYNEFISERHKQRMQEITVIGHEDHQQLAEQYVEVSEAIKEYEARKTYLQSQLKHAMGDAAVMELPSGKITWRKQFKVSL